MKHGSLFSGIGGFDLAAEWMGWENVFHVERDPFCRKILSHHFPKSQTHEDIKTFNGTAFFGGVDIITGGFPCQPFSAAGKRAGTSDDRYLWPEMFRIIREARPTYVLAENVRGLLSWNEGLVLDTVCADLESEGYEVCPVVLPAASVNAPHRRDRIWILATNAPALRLQQRTDSGEVGRGQSEVCEEGNQFAEPIEATRAAWDATNASGMGRQRRRSEEAQGREGQCPGLQPDVKGQGSGAYATNADGEQLESRHKQGTPTGTTYAKERTESLDGPRGWEEFPTFAPICGGDDGLPKRLDNITFPKWRRESIKAYGNAIVPQVAYQIFKAL